MIAADSSTHPDTINVVMAPDNNYLLQAGVAMLSATRHSKAALRFYLLHGGEALDEKMLEVLTGEVVRVGSSVELVMVDAARLAGARAVGYISMSAYYRLLIAETLPEIERAIYLDCDVTVLGDLADLWRTDLQGATLGAVGRIERTDEWLSARYPAVKHYFNSGVLLMNLRQWRERNYTRQCMEFMVSDAEVCQRVADQDLLNVIFARDLFHLPLRWNMRSGESAECRRWGSKADRLEWRAALRQPGVAHYTGAKKPLQFDLRHVYAMEFWRVLAGSALREFVPDFSRQMRRAGAHRMLAVCRDALHWLMKTRINPRRGVFYVNLFGVTLLNVRKRG